MSGVPPQPQQVQRQAEGPGKCTSFGIRAVAAIAGLICVVTGCFTFITVAPMCIVAGIYLILLGFLIEMFEAPICCQYFSFTDKINTWGSNLPAWLKALMYFILPIFAIIMCQGVSVIVGALVVVAVGIMYGMVFIGRKGDGVSRARESHQFDAVNLVESQEHSFTKANP